MFQFCHNSGQIAKAVLVRNAIVIAFVRNIIVRNCMSTLVARNTGSSLFYQFLNAFSDICLGSSRPAFSQWLLVPAGALYVIMRHFRSSVCIAFSVFHSQHSQLKFSLTSVDVGFCIGCFWTCNRLPISLFRINSFVKQQKTKSNFVLIFSLFSPRLDSLSQVGRRCATSR